MKRTYVQYDLPGIFVNEEDQTFVGCAASTPAGGRCQTSPRSRRHGVLSAEPMPSTAAVAPEAALDPKGAARHLNMCLSKVMRLSHAGLMPCRNVNPGGERAVFRYSPAALDKWLQGDWEPVRLPIGSAIHARERKSTAVHA